MFNFIAKRRWWFILSAIIIVPGIIAIALGGLKLGIDFSGGSLVEVSFPEAKPSTVAVEQALMPLELGTVRVQPLGEESVTIRLQEINQETYQLVIERLRAEFGSVEEGSFEAVGPTIGQELRTRAVQATVIVLIAILLYITIVFRKVAGRYVGSWVYGAGAIAALFHDILIVVGAFAIMGKLWNIEIDALFITALLTVLGFSVHDTIVVYDRIRERLKANPSQPFEQTVNESVNQTIMRSVNTSLTTLVVLTALYLFGGESIRFFVLALIIGITAGTYSSIFIASPLLVVWYRWRTTRHAAA